MISGFLMVFLLMTQDAATPAAAPLPPAAAAPDDGAAPTDPIIVEAPRHTPEDVVVCRHSAPTVGSILSHRVCSTARADRERREHDQAEFARMQDIQGRGQPVPLHEDD